MVNVRRVVRLNCDYLVVKGDFVVVLSLGFNLVEYEVCIFYFLDGMCVVFFMMIIFRVYGFRVEGLFVEKLYDF